MEKQQQKDREKQRKEKLKILSEQTKKVAQQPLPVGLVAKKSSKERSVRSFRLKTKSERKIDVFFLEEKIRKFRWKTTSNVGITRTKKCCRRSERNAQQHAIRTTFDRSWTFGFVFVFIFLVVVIQCRVDRWTSSGSRVTKKRWNFHFLIENFSSIRNDENKIPTPPPIVRRRSQMTDEQNSNRRENLLRWALNLTHGCNDIQTKIQTIRPGFFRFIFRRFLNDLNRFSFLQTELNVSMSFLHHTSNFRKTQEICEFHRQFDW